MTFIINQIVLAVFNVINSRLDAYIILKNKTVAHTVNFLAYACVVEALMWVFKMKVGDAAIFGASAFFNRQLSFDIPLNLRRGLPWYYQSTANPPAAWWDKVERKIFGANYDGKKIALWYTLGFLLTTILGVFL